MCIGAGYLLFPNLIDTFHESFLNASKSGGGYGT